MVTPARETTDAVLTPAVIAHVGESGTLVDILTINVTMSFGTKFFESYRSWFRTRVASVAPSFADAATADALQIVALQLLGTDAVSVVEVARLLTLIDAASARLVQCQTRWTGAREGSFGVDADTATFANAGIEVAFVDVSACLAVDFGVTDGTVALNRIAHLARTTPSQSDGTAAL